MSTADINWKNPDYAPVIERRLAMLKRIRDDATGRRLRVLKVHYAEEPVDFIRDWGITVDPRNATRRGADGHRLPTTMPFVLFDKQEELLYWILDRMEDRDNGLIEKSRDEGASWLTVGLGATLCLFRDGFKAGYGSRKEEYVDKIGDPKSLFWKAREFVDNVPREFRAGWVRSRHSPHMRMIFPETNAVMSGEIGDSIGRGDRTSIYFVDEAAHLEHPESVEMSLASTTDCRIDLSSVKGRANPFANKRFSGTIPVFTLHWRDDPRKDEKWYEEQCAKYDAVVIAQEIDIDYMASVENVMIPGKWIQAAIDAHKHLGIAVSGKKLATLDVADGGKDLNALGYGQGILIQGVEDWSGKGSDLFYTATKAFQLCDELGIKHLRYDSDGIGANMKGDSRVLNENRHVDSKITVEAFRGSEAVRNPEKKADGTDRTNGDFFANYKAQSWWELRRRFWKTYNWIENRIPCDPDEIISIAGDCVNREKLIAELSQPTYTANGAGKIVVDKTPEGAKSPNCADAVMMYFAPHAVAPMKITAATIAAMQKRMRR